MRLLLRLESGQNDRAIRYILFRQSPKGLRVFYESGRTKGIQAKHAGRLRMQLAALDTARTIDDMNIPGFGLHPLEGKRKERWVVSVSGNWRLTFEFRDGDAYVLDYEDYH
ncbi:MAG: proteic killer suppression protein [Candidatus Kentron sp. G]|nr:MAG: proteic killer suppression protein [Candidatus Kentron sp. G]